MSLYHRVALIILFAVAVGISFYLGLGGGHVFASCGDSCGCNECLYAGECYGDDAASMGRRCSIARAMRVGIASGSVGVRRSRKSRAALLGF